MVAVGRRTSDEKASAVAIPPGGGPGSAGGRGSPGYDEPLRLYALHYAAIFGRAAIAAELIRRGAPLNVPDRDGETPLWRALHAPAMRYDSAGKSQVDTTEVAQVLRGAGGTK